MKKQLIKIAKFSLIFVLISGWVFSGAPRIFNFPPQTKEALAVENTVDAAISTTSAAHNGSSPTTVFTTASVGYTFYVDSTNYCVYSKTSNSGATWGAAVAVYNAAATCVGIAVWYDRWTPGDDTGNLIHIALINSTDSDILYRNLNTSGDILSAAGENITSGRTYTGTLTNALGKPSITKGTDGALYAAIADATDNMMVRCTATCTTATNWVVSEPASWLVGDDQVLLVPMLSGNLMFIWWDISATSNDLKYSVWGGSSWGAFGNIATALDNTTYDASFGATIDRATGNVYLTYAQNAATLGTDDNIKTAIYSSGAWTAKTNVATASACAGVSNCGITGVKISRDETTGRIFTIYSARTTPATAATGRVYYKYSTDGMTTWSAETPAINGDIDDVYGARVPIMGPRILITHYRATPDDLFGMSIWPEVAGIDGFIGKFTDGWAGAVPVYGMLTGGLTQGSYPYARARVTTIAAQIFYADMTWNAGNSRFEGVIYPGSNICMGCDDPKTYNGSFSVVVQLDNNAGFPSIDYSSSASTFTIAMTVKRTSMDSATSNTNYTDFNSIWLTNHWNTTISDFGFGMKSGTGTNVAVAVPIYPTTSSPTNFAITVNGVSVSPGTAASVGVNAWWWEPTSHSLYIQFASLPVMATTGTVTTDVDIAFDTDTDLFATRYNWTQSYDMGQRWGSNGLYVANQYLSAFFYPRPTSTTDNNLACTAGNECEQAGMQAETRAHPTTGGADQSTDCMERVAVHVDGTARSDGTGAYQNDIKWNPNEYAGWITAQDNNHFVIETNSDSTASTGWAQQLNNGIAAERIQTFYAGKRYIKNVYNFTNNGGSTRSYPMVWEREQWHGIDRQVNDHGRFYGQGSDVVMEQRQSMASFACPWQTAYDSGTFINMGMVYDQNNLPDYGVFAVEPFLGGTVSPYYEWPINITPSHGTQTTDQTGFEKTWATVGAGQTVNFTFWNVHNAETSWANIASAMDADCSELNTPPANVSLTVDLSSTDYGTIPLSAVKKADTANGNDEFIVTNTGDVAEDFDIISTDATGGTTWTLSTTAIGSSIFMHAYSSLKTLAASAVLGSVGEQATKWVAMDKTPNYRVLASNVAISGTVNLVLELLSPSAIGGGDYGVQKTTTVTIRATAH